MPAVLHADHLENATRKPASDAEGYKRILKELQSRPSKPILAGCVYRKLKHARSDGEARRGSYMT